MIFEQNSKIRFTAVWYNISKGSFMKAEFIDQDHSITIDQFVFHKDELCQGNPYNTTFLVFITSGSFSGFGDCEYDIKEFKRFVLELEKMYRFKRKMVVFKDICYGSEIVFAMNQLGGIEIKGTVYADAMEHSLTFCFHTEQSFLLPFINGLKKLIEHANI